jgi:hypothetical protein
MPGETPLTPEELDRVRRNVAAFHEADFIEGDSNYHPDSPCQADIDLSRLLATLDAERARQADPGGLRNEGFAADRPIGPRTQAGYALASKLRRVLGEGVDWDQWVRDIETEAASLPAQPVEPHCCCPHEGHDLHAGEDGRG